MMPRMLEYLSPSSIGEFLKDREEFYMTRLAEHRPARWPQDNPQAAGSAFDAYVKSHLHEILFGRGADPQFEFQTLFEAQVEPQCRDWALVNGEQIFIQYRNSGALADLLIDLKRAKGTISFESTVKGQVGGVELLGKPDCYYINEAGFPVILDWKVNGWCGKGNTSPKPGYVRCRGTREGGNSSTTHKNCIPIDKHGVEINGFTTLEKLDDGWARQLTIYGWLYGAPVGSEFICAIDQIAGDGSKGGEWPTCRVAEHRLLCSPEFQRELLAQAQHIWESLKTGYIFSEMSKSENDMKCAQLEARAQLYKDKPEFAEMFRKKAGYRA